MSEKSDKDKKASSMDRMKKALKYSSTMPAGTGGATTGAWLMGSSHSHSHDHEHGHGCGCGHSHDDDDH